MTSVLTADPRSELSIERVPTLTPEIAAFFGNVVWGTEGALYKVIGFEKTLAHLPHPQYLTLRQGGKLTAVRMVFSKKMDVRGKMLTAFYHSMFSVLPGERGKGFGKKMAQATMDQLLPALGLRGFLYAYVEEGNKRSESISKSLGYQTIGSFYATAISRFFPQDSPHVRALRPWEENVMRGLLNEQYRSDHALLDFDISLLPGSCWVYTDDSGIAAGLQVDPQQWIIQSLSGPGGAFALKALPHIPLLKDLFNPTNFQFLKIGNIFFRKGSEKAVFKLIEAVLKRSGLKTAMAYFDKRSPAYQALASAGRFGILNPLVETKVNVLAYAHNLETREVAALQMRPLVISPMDI